MITFYVQLPFQTVTDGYLNYLAANNNVHAILEKNLEMIRVLSKKQKQAKKTIKSCYISEKNAGKQIKAKSLYFCDTFMFQ